jgi:hypothetical protein
MAKVLECLPSKLKALSSNPRTRAQKKTAHTYTDTHPE